MNIGLLIAWAIADDFTMMAKLPALILLHPAGGRAFLKLTYQTLSFHRIQLGTSYFTRGAGSHLLPAACDTP